MILHPTLRTHTCRLSTAFPAGGTAGHGPGLQLGTKSSQNPGSLVLIKGLLLFVNLHSLPRIEAVSGWPRTLSWLQLQAGGAQGLSLPHSEERPLRLSFLTKPPSRASKRGN